jgi:hypothetical protein
MPMTPLQAECLAYIQFLLSSELKGLAALYKPSGIMAHIQIESSFQPEVGDHVDTFGSCGLMQVLPATAIQMGVKGSMLDPCNSILAGMRYLDNCRTILGHYAAQQGGGLQIEKVVAAYNEGPGNVLHGRQDPSYVEAWTKAQKQWAYVDALPMDPKAAAALESWTKAGSPSLTAAPSDVEAEPMSQKAVESGAAAHGDTPDQADHQEQPDEAELLNKEELGDLNKPPVEGVVQATQSAADPVEGNASLTGA